MPLFPKARFEIHADDKSKKGTDSASKNLDRLKKNITLAGVASVAAAGIGGLGVLTVAGIRLGDELAKTSDKLGLSTEGLAGLRNAARLTGVETNKLDLGLQRMTRRVAEAAQGSGEAQGALKELGLDARRLSELAPDQQFREIAEAMKDVSSQSDRVRLGFKLFDSEGVDLIRTLDLGTEGLDAAAREAEKFGTAISSVRAREIELAGDALGRVRTAAEGLSTQLAASLAPTIASAANTFADWIAFITNTGLPAFGLLAERISGVEINVRALSEQELLVRTITLTDKIEGLQAAIQKAGSGARNAFGGTNVKILPSLDQELTAAQKTLVDVEARIEKIRSGSEISPIAEISLGGLPKRRDEVNPEFTAALFRRAAALRAEQAGEQEKREQATAQLRAELEAGQRAAELESVRSFLKTREELEADAYKRREEIILENMEAGQERDALLLENARNRANALIEIERHKEEEITRAIIDGTATRQEFENASAQLRTRAALGHLQKLTAGVAVHNRAMFELNKVAAIAEGVLGAREAVLGAYKVGAKIGGPYLGAAFAAAAGLATASQIAAIASTSFGGGSTPSVVGSTPTLEGQPVPQATSGAAPETAGNRNTVEIHVHGGLLATDELKRILQDQFDADEVIIHGSSRQAAAIRTGT